MVVTVLGVVLLALAALLAVASTPATGTGTETSIDVETNKKFYDPGETVTITITNTGTQTLSGMPSCHITDENGNIVTTFYFAAVIWQLEPGESITLTWNQVDDNGNAVSPGRYVVWGSFGGYSDSEVFYIREEPSPTPGFEALMLIAAFALAIFGTTMLAWRKRQ
jgi:hypothetical protein